MCVCARMCAYVCWDACVRKHMYESICVLYYRPACSCPFVHYVFYIFYLQACRNFNNSGSCVSQCPQAFIYNKEKYKMEPNPNAKYQYGSICVPQCPSECSMQNLICF